jgi:hypothetical protein
VIFRMFNDFLNKNPLDMNSVMVSKVKKGERKLT